MLLDSVSTEPGYQAQFGGVTQGSRNWEHNKTPQYTLSPSWPYRMPQNFIQQGNGSYQPGKPFMAQGEKDQRETSDKACSCVCICIVKLFYLKLTSANLSTSAYVLMLTFCLFFFLYFLFPSRFCGAPQSEFPTGTPRPAPCKSKFHPAEKVNLHLHFIRLMVSTITKQNNVILTLHHLVTRISKMNFIIFVQFLCFFVSLH